MRFHYLLTNFLKEKRENKEDESKEGCVRKFEKVRKLVGIGLWRFYQKERRRYLTGNNENLREK